MNHFAALILIFPLANCSGAMTTLDASLEGDGGPEDAALPLDAGPTPDAGPAPDAATEATVFVHLVASHAPVEHAAATSGQTPRDWVSGIRSLHLLRTEDDPDPFLVFSHGDGFVEASYADGADTIVGSAPIASLAPGTYTWARAVHTHVRFTIDATLHAGFGPMPGELEDLIVLSDRTTLDGVEHARGDYRFAFTTAGRTFPTEGTGYEIPPVPGGGFSTRIEDGETAYYFPVYLVVTDELTTDVHLMFDVNVHEGFRWTDTDAPEYAADVFDITSVGTEPIVQAGANRYGYRVE